MVERVSILRSLQVQSDLHDLPELQAHRGSSSQAVEAGMAGGSLLAWKLEPGEKMTVLLALAGMILVAVELVD